MSSIGSPAAMRGSNAIIGSCAAAVACPEGIAARGLDGDDTPASPPERLDARRLNPDNIPEPEVECDLSAPRGVFDGPAPDVSPGLASERCEEEARKRFLILSMLATNGMRGIVRLDHFESDKART